MTLAVTSSSAFALQIVALVTGGSIVQLIVYLLRRRSEIAALDKTASAPLLASANELIVRLEVAEGRLASRVASLEGQLAESQGTLRLSQEDNQRLTREVAQLRIDLDITQRHVDQLRLMLPMPQPPPPPPPRQNP